MKRGSCHNLAMSKRATLFDSDNITLDQMAQDAYERGKERGKMLRSAEATRNQRMIKAGAENSL